MAFEAALVVMAAGMGSRFGGLKQVEPVGPKGEAILDFSVYDAKRAGFTKVVFVIKHQIEEEFKRLVGSRVEKQIPVEYVFQETDLLPEGYTCPPGREKPWGTGQAVWCCKDVVDVPFAVINADDFYGAQSYRQIIRGLQEKTAAHGGILPWQYRNGKRHRFQRGMQNRKWHAQRDQRTYKDRFRLPL